MSKKLLFNAGNTTESEYVVETLNGNPIYVRDLAVTDEQQADIIGFSSSASIDTIIIYSSNCDQIFAKGGKINANS